MNSGRLTALWPDVARPLDRFGADGSAAESLVVSLAGLIALRTVCSDVNGRVVPDELAATIGRGPANVRRDLDQLARRGVLRRDRNLGYFIGENEEIVELARRLCSRMDSEAEFRLAVAATAYEREIEALADELETRRVTQLAKRALMRSRGMSEDEAHSFLLKRSRDHNVTLKQLAASVMSGEVGDAVVLPLLPTVRTIRSRRTTGQ